MQAQTVETPAPTMRMASVPDGKGGFIHKLVPANDTAPVHKGKKKKHTPDPIKANPEAAAQQLGQFIERIERLEEEKQSIADDIKDVYLEAKANGYDAKAMRAIVALRKQERHTRLENEALLETYKTALRLD